MLFRAQYKGVLSITISGECGRRGVREPGVYGLVPCQRDGILLAAGRDVSCMRLEVLRGSVKDGLFELPKRIKETVRWYRIWRSWPVKEWVRAASLFRDGEFRYAVSYYRLGLQERPKHRAAPSAKLDLAYCLYRLDEFQEALDILDQLILLPHGLREAHLLKSRILAILDQPEAALEVLENYLEREPEDIKALIEFLHTAVFAGAADERLAKVRGKLIQAQRRLPLEHRANGGIDAALAHYELKHGSSGKGDKLLARVLAGGVPPVEAVVLRGERLLELGRLQQCREQLSRAIKAAPKNPRPVVLLAQSYLRKNGSDFNPAWAVSLAECACKLSHWTSRQCLAVLAAACEANNEKEKAELFWERLKKLEKCSGRTDERHERVPALKVSNT